MTKKEAINRVQGYLTSCLSIEDYDEVEEIIKALKQEPCEDAISRAKAIEICKSRGHDNSAYYISQLPSVTPIREERKER